MSSIQSINQTTVTAERLLPRAIAGTGRHQRPASPEIAPEPLGKTMLSASGADDLPGPGLRAHPPEAADNLLGRMPPQHEGKLDSRTEKQVSTPPQPPGQLAVMLLSMISQTESSSGSAPAPRPTLDVMA